VAITFAVVLTAAHGGFGGRRSLSDEVKCKPGWFVPGLAFSLKEKGFVQPDVRYVSLWRNGICRIDPRRPFSWQLTVVGADGSTVDSQHGAFSGDMNAGGSTGGGSTIRLATWCAHQPVQVTLTGAGPGYARSGKGYRLILSRIAIRCPP